jgi:hypothetical protein
MHEIPPSMISLPRPEAVVPASGGLCGKSLHSLDINVLFSAQTVTSVTFVEESIPGRNFLIKNDLAPVHGHTSSTDKKNYRMRDRSLSRKSRLWPCCCIKPHTFQISEGLMGHLERNHDNWALKNWVQCVDSFNKSTL